MGKKGITKTELVWPGKYQEGGTPSATSRAQLSLSLRECFTRNRKREASQQQWHNKLIWGDNLLVMHTLLEEFAGKVDLIYIDPPFATGEDFIFSSPIGDGESEESQLQPVIQEKAYHDTWGRGLSAYLSMLWQRLPLLRALLSDTGSIYVHLGWEVSGYVQLLMNEIFGENCRQNIIIYNYGKFHHSKERWKRDFDVILFYSKNPTTWTFNHDAVLDEYRERTEIRFGKVDEAGKRYKIVKGRRVYRQEGVTPSSVWRLSHLQMNAVESLGYPTQKTEGLLTKIIAASSHPGDLIADFFCGSGTTLAVAENLGRRWIGCDVGRFAIHTTRKRLLSLADCASFDVLDLGEDERQVWLSTTFGAGEKICSGRELSAYRAFVLQLYGAQPIGGLAYLHGKKSGAMVRIGTVGAPVTRVEIEEAIGECLKLKQSKLHVLGWEWEVSVDTLRDPEGETRGVKIHFIQIPREVMERQAREKGEVQFLPLASLMVEVEIQRDDSHAIPLAKVALKDFSIPQGTLFSRRFRAQIKRWSDYIDYWAVDWDFQDDTFTPRWVTYRTRKDRTLALTSVPHRYDRAGTYRVLVKVVDIFGSETSREIKVNV